MNYQNSINVDASREVFEQLKPSSTKGPLYFFMKRALDIVLASTLLILFLPFLLVISFLIFAHDRGSPIFSQERIGLYGRKFKCLKIRTMIVNAQNELDRVLATDPQAAAEWKRDQKLRNDPRITKVGKFLRKTSLDELPQLINIIKGDMSFIGPRPIVTSEVKKYGRFFGYYTSVKPGISGLWQISGRNNTTYDERVALDVKYAKRKSFRFDLWIMLKTVPVVLLSRGAF